MAGDHHIRQQQLIIELPTVDPRQATRWHDRLEELQERVIAPELVRQLDHFAPPGVTVHLDRLTVAVTLDDPDRLGTVFADAFAAELAHHLSTALGEPPSIPAKSSKALLHFLVTGNLPWTCPTPTDLEDLVGTWLDIAEPHDWLPLLRLLEHQPSVFLGRAAQVPANFLAQAWRVLHSGAVDHRSAALGSPGPPDDPVLWHRQWVRFREDQPTEDLPRRPAQRSTGPINTTPHEGYYPENAGIVLLHPYFGYLLEKVGAVDAQAGEPDRPRCAALFHYLVTGKPAPREWDLPLTKVLLGLSPTDPLTAAISISETDRRACNDLLDGIIGHWTALGNTSRAGLREGFLQRPGVLTAENGGWHLEVERRAHDLLLDRLPWGFHLIKTAWMPDRLCVNWA